jgi:hypothetical protein
VFAKTLLSWNICCGLLLKKHATIRCQHNVPRHQGFGNHTYYYVKLYIEAIEIYKHMHNFNKKEEDLQPSKAWYSTLKKKHFLNTNTNVKADNQSEVKLFLPDQSKPVPADQTYAANSIITRVRL